MTLDQKFHVRVNVKKIIFVNFIIQNLKSKHSSLKKYTNWGKLSHMTQDLEFTSWPTSCGPLSVCSLFLIFYQNLNHKIASTLSFRQIIGNRLPKVMLSIYLMFILLKNIVLFIYCVKIWPTFFTWMEVQWEGVLLPIASAICQLQSNGKAA